MMAACCGIENNLGSLVTPLRTCYNKAEEEFLSHLPHAYFEVVMSYNNSNHLVHTGVFAGNDIDTYLNAASFSLRQNITTVPPLKKVVAFMQDDEFFSTWVANKAIYRTRMAIADGGELLIVAPGLKRFGEQEEVDSFIRKYGYCGTDKIMKLWQECHQSGDLRDLTHATAHLIHGSSDGRFTITYAPGHLTESEVRSVNFNFVDIRKTQERYVPEKMRQGFNSMPDGEEIYFIRTPAAGLWSTIERLRERPIMSDKLVEVS
jgi:nickel-dependent lactate racemase